MPSFDIVSEIDRHELGNAVDQANREVANRFDFKGTGAEFVLTDNDINLKAQVEFQLDQMFDILTGKFAKRSLDIRCLERVDALVAGNEARQQVKVKVGIDQELARRLVKTIKQSKMKVQAAIQGDQVRVTGKKRDDLQAVIALVKDEKIDHPLQFDNFRD
ncbi:MAG: YajQ family cyclic di-GMP-binding protein [Gammaproteobacteria bacterium]